MDAMNCFDGIWIAYDCWKWKKGDGKLLEWQFLLFVFVQ